MKMFFLEAVKNDSFALVLIANKKREKESGTEKIFRIQIVHIVQG